MPVSIAYPLIIMPPSFGSELSVSPKTGSVSCPFGNNSLNGVQIPRLTTSSFHSIGTFIKGNIGKLVSNYPTVEDKGINGIGATPAQIQLARIASRVAEDMDTKGYCYTGVKHALWTAGLIDDYADMPKGNAPNSVKYFEQHSETFEEVKDVKPEDIKKLTAGSIIVFQKEGEIGHIGIANGKGQLYSDCTDPATWYEQKGGAEKGVSYRVFKIKNNLVVNTKTGKIEQPSEANKDCSLNNSILV